MLRRSRGPLELWRLEGGHIVGPSDPRLPLEHEDGGHTCRAKPLILFNPSKPFARVFFLSCCLNAFRPCVREVSDALRPSWKLAASMLPWFCKSKLEERARGVPAGPKAPGPVPEMRREEKSPTTGERGGLVFEEDFRQLSEDAPSEGLTTIQGGLHWWNRLVETSASVCLREVVLGRWGG